MATTFEDIYSQFQNKVNDYTWLAYEVSEIENEFYRFLKSAKSRFYTCDNLNSKNEILKQFDVDLTDREIEILTEIMILMWIERQVQDITRFKDRLSSSDYQGFSKANLLDKILNTKKDKLNEIDKILSEYGTQKSIDFMKKKVGMI